MEPEIYQGFKRATGFKIDNFFWVKEYKIKQYEEQIRLSDEQLKQYEDEMGNATYTQKYRDAKKNFESNTRQLELTQDWDGYVSICCPRGHCKCFMPKKGLHFPTGVLYRVITYFKENNVPFKISDCREKPTTQDMQLKMSDDFEIRDYQLEAVQQSIKKGRGIIRCATGGGKTAIASNIIATLALSPTVFYVTSRDLMRQAKSELSKFIKQANGEDIEVGVIGDGVCDIRDINVMTIQTAITSVGQKYEKFDQEEKEKLTAAERKMIENKRLDINDLIRRAKVIFCDECQHWASSTAKVLSDYSLSAYYKIGASATPYRDTGDDLIIEGAFGRLITDISASLLIRRSVLVRPNIRFFRSPEVEVTKKRFDAVYKQSIVENTGRNDMISELATELYNEGGRVLILCQMIDHGKALEKMIPNSVFMHGKWTSKRRAKLLDEVREGHPSITIATSLFDEGVDVRPLNCLILAGAGSSPTRALQRIGRVIRSFTYNGGVAKTDAVVVDFIDSPDVLLQQSRKRLKIYKTESEFDIQVYQ
jgi:superfamily II DNA or RNA helicase